ncbi:MAG: conjugal transfer protein TraH [Nitrospiria bacterium]
MIKKSLVVILVLIFTIGIFPGNLFADMASDLTSMLGAYNTMSNASVPGAYQGQANGYLSGGAISVRLSPRTDLSLLTITPPSIRAGCGGIDLVGGGLKYLNPQQLVQKIQSFVASAPATLFFVALQTLSPELATINGELNKMADFMNGMSLDSCKMAQDLVGKGAGWVSQDLLGESKVKCMERQKAIGLNIQEAQTACTSGTGTSTPAVTDGTKLSIEHNFTYEAIKGKDYFTDPVLTQEILSLLGTVTFTAATGGNADFPEVVSAEFPPILSVEALLYGTTAGIGVSTANVYQCPGGPGGVTAPDYVCSGKIAGDMSQTSITLTPLVTQIQTTLSGILTQISTYPTTTALTASQIMFINNNWIPVYAYLNSISMNPALTAAELPMISDVMARMMVRQYIEDIIRNINISFAKLANEKGGAQFTQGYKTYKESVALITQELNKYGTNSPQDIFYLFERIKAVTDITMQRFPKEIVANLTFNKKQ